MLRHLTIRPSSDSRPALALRGGALTLYVLSVAALGILHPPHLEVHDESPRSPRLSAACADHCCDPAHDHEHHGSRCDSDHCPLCQGLARALLPHATSFGVPTDLAARQWSPPELIGGPTRRPLESRPRAPPVLR